MAFVGKAERKYKSGIRNWPSVNRRLTLLVATTISIHANVFTTCGCHSNEVDNNIPGTHYIVHNQLYTAHSGPVDIME